MRPLGNWRWISIAYLALVFLILLLVLSFTDRIACTVLYWSYCLYCPLLIVFIVMSFTDRIPCTVLHCSCCFYCPLLIVLLVLSFIDCVHCNVDYWSYCLYCPLPIVLFVLSFTYCIPCTVLNWSYSSYCSLLIVFLALTVTDCILCTVLYWSYSLYFLVFVFVFSFFFLDVVLGIKNSSQITEDRSGQCDKIGGYCKCFGFSLALWIDVICVDIIAYRPLRVRSCLYKFTKLERKWVIGTSWLILWFFVGIVCELVLIPVESTVVMVPVILLLWLLL